LTTPHGSASAIDRFAGPLLAALVLAGLALRLRGFASAWPNPDEGDYYAIALLPNLAAVWAEIAHHTHPPGIYLLEHLLARVSAELGWLRSPSLVAGLATIAACHAAGRAAHSRAAGLACAAVVAFSPAAIALSQSLRPYALAGALAAWAFAAVIAHARDPSRALRARAALFFALALTVHYSVALLLPGAAFALARSAPREGRARAELALAFALWASIVAALTLAHIAPHLLGQPIQQAAQQNWLASYFPSSPAEIAAAIVGVARLALGDALALAGVAAVAVGGAHCARSGATAPLALALGALAISLAAAVLEQYPLGATRHSFFLALAWLPLLGIGFARALAGGTRARAAAGLIAAVSFASALAHPAPPALAEHLATRDEMRAALAPIEAERAVPALAGSAPRLLVLDRQTFRFLAPYFGAAGAAHLRSPEHPALFTHFEWGGLRVLVASAWVLRTGDEAVDRRDHLFGFLLRANAAPDLEGLPIARATGIFARGGWNVRDATTGAATVFALDELDVAAVIARYQPLARERAGSRSHE